MKDCTKRIILLFSHCIPSGIGKCHVPHKGKFAKNDCNRSQCKIPLEEERGLFAKTLCKLILYIQVYFLRSYALIISQYLQASRCMCTGGLPEIRADKDCQLSRPHFLCWVALCWWWQGRFLARTAVASLAKSSYAAIFLPVNSACLVLYES